MYSKVVHTLFHLTQVVISDIVGQDIHGEISEAERQERIDTLELELMEEGVLASQGYLRFGFAF